MLRVFASAAWHFGGLAVGIAADALALAMSPLLALLDAIARVFG